MMWTKFAEATKDKPDHTILSYACFHLGRTTTISRSTIRTTGASKHQALVMETDIGECLIALSKAQGCESEQRQMLNFLGWMRRYDTTPKDKHAWDQIDDEIDRFYRDVSGEVPDQDDNQQEHSAKMVTPSSWEWRELLMIPRKNHKDVWSYVYAAYIDGQYYTLLNKGASFLQSGKLDDWYPQRAASMPTNQKLNVQWLWIMNNELHFSTADADEYIISCGDLVCRRRRDHGSQASIWVEKYGMIEPHSKKYFPAALVEHIAGRKPWRLPLNAFYCHAKDKIDTTWNNCTQIHTALHFQSPHKLTVAWQERPWSCYLVEEDFSRGPMRYSHSRLDDIIRASDSNDSNNQYTHSLDDIIRASDSDDTNNIHCIHDD